MGAPRYLPAGESALVVEFGTTAEDRFHDQVLALDAALAAHPIDGIRETVPTYRSLMVHFDPRKLTPEALTAALGGVAQEGAAKRAPRHWRIPACYEAPYGEDLDEVAAALDLSPERIAELHAGPRYRVVMYGFAPGFVFLAGLPEALTISRRQTPRAAAPPGSLTIANGQALIASIAMPTGWYVLGRTPVKTFDPGRDPAFPIAVGDEVSFEAINAEKFDDLARDEAGAPREAA